MTAEEFNLYLPHKYESRFYQDPFWEAMKTKKRAVLVWHRRAGKEKTCWNYLILQACRKVGIYYYFFPHFSQGRKILWDGVDKEGFALLNHIPKELIFGSPNSTEMKVRLRNGSLIQIIGTNNVDSIVGTNPIGCVFTEYSLQDPKAWTLIRPILRENKGWAVFNFCVHEETLVFTEYGIKKISKVINNSQKGFTDLSLGVYGIDGYHRAVNFYNGGIKPLIKIITKKGYELSCTPNHPILSLNGWKRADEWKTGDIIPIQRGQNSWGNTLDCSEWVRPPVRKETNGSKNYPYNPVMEEDLAYLLGLILAEGSWDKDSVTIANIDESIVCFINSKGFKSYDRFQHKFRSSEFVSFIEWVGLIRGEKNREFPEKILRFPKSIVSAFISGYFDGDGYSTKRGTIYCYSASERLITQLQVVLLNFGIISNKSVQHAKPTEKVKGCSKVEKVKGCSTVYKLELTKDGAIVFFRDIGFRLTRKQERRSWGTKRFLEGNSDLIPLQKEWICGYSKGLSQYYLKRKSHITYKKAVELLEIKKDPWLESVVKSNYFYDSIRRIEPFRGPVYDFVIPETHSFFSNGFISHNTPRGANHSKELFDMATNNPNWFCQFLTVDDTGVLTPEDIQKERDEGMSEDFIQQEYYCSFTLGVEGSYYAKYMQEARDEERICNVSYNRQSKVHTAWDIGYGDSASIVFYQISGQEIHIIDYYENQGEGLPHYAKVLQDRAYLYGDNFAPHDIESHSFSSGLSAKEVGAGLGISFITLPTLKIRIEDGIEAVRGLFPRFWFDEVKCKRLIKCLENYRKEFDENMQTYKHRPRHDTYSHGADAFRYLAIAVKRHVDGEKEGVDDKQADRWYNAAHPNFSA
jgi:intein/homing endonuclease